MTALSADAIRAVLAPFGTLRAQPASDWTGVIELPPVLARFYTDVGPWGEEGPDGPNGLWIPGGGNPFAIPPLGRLWALQAGYRWLRHPTERLADWPDTWLVVADEGGDPFILHCDTGVVSFARHSEG